MVLSKFSVFNIQIALCKFENKTQIPIYAIRYKRGTKEEFTYEHFSISYTREQAFKIYVKMIVYISSRYLIIKKIAVL